MLAVAGPYGDDEEGGSWSWRWPGKVLQPHFREAMVPLERSERRFCQGHSHDIVLLGRPGDLAQLHVCLLQCLLPLPGVASCTGSHQILPFPFTATRDRNNMVNCQVVTTRTILTGEVIPVKNVFTAKALLDPSSLYYLQQLWNPQNCRDVEGPARRRDGLVVVLQHMGLHSFPMNSRQMARFQHTTLTGL